MEIYSLEYEKTSRTAPPALLSEAADGSKEDPQLHPVHSQRKIGDIAYITTLFGVKEVAEEGCII